MTMFPYLSPTNYIHKPPPISLTLPINQQDYMVYRIFSTFTLKVIYITFTKTLTL